ncbi:MAG: hypothetical protein K2P16_07490 [Lawsonibacter sp.]|jgi:hypothetical protein|nr:hypothetical protein [Lawsonibacter sp.]MCI9026857.1 hypothetical protein [Lawsonibacter sp.]MCI9294051.1 hypothetical protein [Lawsonibacter sp.]MCI9655441.1 hypothetical protein [Lawsonibacter sp.]MDE6899084.1 hypothetical protein [Lawsonibacter sp.]
MTEKIKTGLCVLALLLALLAAYTQEMSARTGPMAGTAVQPAPFAAIQIK